MDPNPLKELPQCNGGPKFAVSVLLCSFVIVNRDLVQFLFTFDPVRAVDRHSDCCIRYKSYGSTRVRGAFTRISRTGQHVAHCNKQALSRQKLYKTKAMLRNSNSEEMGWVSVRGKIRRKAHVCGDESCNAKTRIFGLHFCRRQYSLASINVVGSESYRKRGLPAEYYFGLLYKFTNSLYKIAFIRNVNKTSVSR